MKNKHTITLIATLLLITICSTFSYSTPEGIIPKDYTFNYHNETSSTKALISNGEIYVKASDLLSFLNYKWSLSGQSLTIKDTTSKSKTIKDAEGNLYTGDMLNGKRHGDGVLFMISGGKYDGEWENDCYQGNGTLVLESGNIYIGAFSKGFMHGHGKMIYSDGSYYDGDFEYGVRDGFGKYYINPKNKYTGYWENGMKNGKGKALIDSVPKKGLWENNQLIKILPQSSFDF